MVEVAKEAAKGLSLTEVFELVKEVVRGVPDAEARLLVSHWMGSTPVGTRSNKAAREAMEAYRGGDESGVQGPAAAETRLIDVCVAGDEVWQAGAVEAGTELRGRGMVEATVTLNLTPFLYDQGDGEADALASRSVFS